MSARICRLLHGLLGALAVLFCLLLAAHLLAGCGGGDPQDAGTPDQPAPALLCTPKACQ